MRPSFIYSVLHLPTFAFFTAATPTGWNEAKSKTCVNPFDLNKPAAEEIHGQIASSPAMDKFIDPNRFTPEELAAANILVFLSARGPNPSAGVQSASSHGRDHRRYPLEQQSSSCRFPSTGTGKRKTSDSSAGSTSQRYKKANTSDKYEPNNLIKQHLPLEDSVSDVIATSSKPRYVLPTEKNPATDTTGKFKNKELAGFTGLEKNKKERTHFNVYDWNFLRERPESEKADDPQHEYLRYLHQCKGASDIKDFFFIHKDRTKEFLADFVARKSQFEYNLPWGIHPGHRHGMLFKTLLKLSDTKINLDSYPFFKEQIIEGMKQRLIKNFQTTKNPSSRPNLKTIVKFVQDVTKVTQLLIVAQLSLFKEHEKEQLTVEEVEKHLRFLQELWFQIDKGAPDILKNDWAIKAHHLFKFQEYQHHIYVLAVRKDTKYNFCWNLVNYWREKTGRSLRGLDGPQKFPFTLQEVVNKMIYFSNYPNKPSSLSKKPKEYKKRKKT